MEAARCRKTFKPCGISKQYLKLLLNYLPNSPFPFAHERKALILISFRLKQNFFPSQHRKAKLHPEVFHSHGGFARDKNEMERLCLNKSHSVDPVMGDNFFFSKQKQLFQTFPTCALGKKEI
jgi:hypothetical protein